MTPLESDLVKLAKLARRKDIRPQFAALRDLHGVTAVTAKLNQCFGEDGARELLTWLAEDDSAPMPAEQPETPIVRPADVFPLVGAIGWYKGRKESPASATIDRGLKSAKIEGGNVRLEYGKLDGWKSQVVDGATCDGHVCIAFIADDGTLIAGRFDHKKVGQTVKTLANIGGGIISGNGKVYKPRKGDTVGFFILDRTGKLRTNTVATTWP
jgi:hypothetical protein